MSSAPTCHPLHCKITELLSFNNRLLSQLRNSLESLSTFRFVSSSRVLFCFSFLKPCRESLEHRRWSVGLLLRFCGICNPCGILDFAVGGFCCVLQPVLDSGFCGCWIMLRFATRAGFWIMRLLDYAAFCNPCWILDYAVAGLCCVLQPVLDSGLCGCWIMLRFATRAGFWIMRLLDYAAFCNPCWILDYAVAGLCCVLRCAKNCCNLLQYAISCILLRFAMRARIFYNLLQFATISKMRDSPYEIDSSDKLVLGFYYLFHQSRIL